MSLIDIPKPLVPAIADVVLDIKNSNRNLYIFIKNQLAGIFNTVWHDPNYSPEQIITAMGTDASALFVVAAQLQQLAAQVDPTYVVLAPPDNYSVTLNQDGTVNVAKKG